MDIKKYVAAKTPQLIAWRRYFHEYPEGSQQEFKTMEYIEKQLTQMGLSSVRVPRGGILSVIDSGKPGYTLLMRADIDALPIQEDPVNLTKPKVVVSQNEGFCHACGHDGHMAMLLTEAAILAEHTDEWEGKVILMFEQSEEFGDRGVTHIVQYLHENGVHIDACFGTHVRSDMPVGKIAVLDGSALAGAYFFRITLHGCSGHGSRPDLSVSPIEAFLDIGSALRSVRMRAVAPDHCLTYSIGSLHAGKEPNIIPDALHFSGSCRFFANEDGKQFQTQLHRLLEHVCGDHGCTFDITEEQFLPVTINDLTCAALARKAIDELEGPGTLYPMERWMGSETFSLALSMYPGIYAFTGIQDNTVGSGANHHNAKFDIAEDGLITGAECALAYALAVLTEKPDLSGFVPGNLPELLKYM